MDLERDFAAWAEHRDPDALTRVFDATAGRLLLAATHLVGPETAPEDLLQATFLAAMDRAATWDRGRPLWPWLAGILHNEARMRWRSSHRRREVTLEHAAHTATGRPDPATLVASDEAFRSLLAAIDALPTAYRQALRLRLVHGLQTAEIARALERPVGTVRAQLHRGLERLRQTLPAGLAPVLAIWPTGDAPLLAAVRARIVERATSMAGAVTASSTAGVLAGGWWIMNGKTLSFSIAGLALLATLLLVVLPGSGDPAPSERQPASSARVAASTDSSTAPELTQAAPATREDVAAAPVTPASAWPLVVHVQSPSGPFVNADVTVWVGPSDIAAENQHPDAAWREDVAHGPTDNAGDFCCGLDQFRARSALFRGTSVVFIEVLHPAGGRATERLALPRTDTPTVLTAEVDFGSPTSVLGRVVDTTGLPVAGATIHELFGHEREPGSPDARTDRDGQFALPVYSDEGRLQWPARIAIFSPSAGTALATLPTDQPAAEDQEPFLDLGTIELDGAHAIRGEVVLGDGSPLGGYSLFVARIDAAIATDHAAIRRSFLGRQSQLALNGDEPPVQHRTAPTTRLDGSFVCAGLDPQGVYAISVPSMGRHHTLTVARVGETVRIEVECQLLTLRAEGSEAEPLPGATVRADVFDPHSDNPVWSTLPGVPTKGQVAGGAFFNRDAHGDRMVLSPFQRVWYFYTTDEFAAAPPLRHETFAGVYRAERTFVLNPVRQFGALRLVVEDSDGQPLRHYGFRLDHQTSEVQRNHTLVIPPADLTYRELPAGRWKLTVLFGHPLPEVFGLDTPARGTHEQDILITDGKTTEIRVVSRPAGRVAFRLRSDVPPTNAHWRGMQIRDLSTGLAVPCELHSDDQMRSPWPLAQQFFLAGSAFEPGQHSFRIEVEGYQTTTSLVEVHDGRLTQVHVDLTPR